MRVRPASVAAAALIGIGLTILFEQAFRIDGPGVFFFALGLAFFVAFFQQNHPTHLVVPAGILTGLGLGLTLGALPVGPDYLHPPMALGALALGFVSIYVFGEPRHHRWALWPAAGFGVLAWMSFVSSAPWLKDTFGTLAHFTWPLLLVGAGVWLIERAREKKQQI